MEEPINGCWQGSISISMTLYQTSFCFVCTHLASGEKEGDEVRRNSDVIKILKKTRFSHSLKLLGRQSSHDQILEHEWVFLTMNACLQSYILSKITSLNFFFFETAILFGLGILTTGWLLAVVTLVSCWRKMTGKPFSRKIRWDFDKNIIYTAVSVILYTLVSLWPSLVDPVVWNKVGVRILFSFFPFTYSWFCFSMFGSYW